MIFKVQHFWDKDWGDIIIPFICKRCGRCCNELGTWWTLYDVKIASDHLNIEPVRFLVKYLEGKKADDEISYVKTLSPCPLLVRKNECKVYDARPLACRLYPLKTISGTGGVSCPAVKETNMVIGEMAKLSPYVTTNHFVNYGREEDEVGLTDAIWNLPNLDRWDEFKIVYSQLGVSEESKKSFLELNEKVREYWTP